MLLDVVHNILLPISQKRIEGNYLDPTLRELMIFNHQSICLNWLWVIFTWYCVNDNKENGLGYGFWLGKVFEYFHVSFKYWQKQTIKDVLWEIDLFVIPATSRGVNAPVQHLKA